MGCYLYTQKDFLLMNITGQIKGCLVECQIKNQQTKLINKRKEQLINDEDVPDYSKGRNQLLVLVIGVIVVLLALYELAQAM